MVLWLLDAPLKAGHDSQVIHLFIAVALRRYDLKTLRPRLPGRAAGLVVPSLWAPIRIFVAVPRSFDAQAALLPRIVATVGSAPEAGGGQAEAFVVERKLRLCSGILGSGCSNQGRHRNHGNRDRTHEALLLYLNLNPNSQAGTYKACIRNSFTSLWLQHAPTAHACL
jgi:hypothetical protein